MLGTFQYRLRVTPRQERYGLLALPQEFYNVALQERTETWGILLGQVAPKAEGAPRYAIAVDPKGTSQICSGCGKRVRKALNGCSHWCLRDRNAPRNILERLDALRDFCP